MRLWLAALGAATGLAVMLGLVTYSRGEPYAVFQAQVWIAAIPFGLLALRYLWAVFGDVIADVTADIVGALDRRLGTDLPEAADPIPDAEPVGTFQINTPSSSITVPKLSSDELRKLAWRDSIVAFLQSIGPDGDLSAATMRRRGVCHPRRWKQITDVLSELGYIHKEQNCGSMLLVPPERAIRWIRSGARLPLPPGSPPKVRRYRVIENGTEGDGSRETAEMAGTALGSPDHA